MKTTFVCSLFLFTVMCFSLSAQQSTPSATNQSSSSAQSSPDVNQANQNQANQNSTNQNSTSQPSTSSTTTDQSSPSSQETSDQNSATQDSTNQNPSSSSQNPGSSQNPANQNANEQGNQGQVPTYRVTVVERSTEAVDYRDRGGTTQVDFKGTTLAPRVTGNAKVTGHTGRLAIDANVRGLPSPRSFGPEYLTYVLWAITPEGRAVNLGEMIPNDDGNSRVQVTSGLQVFGLIVTAEPYFAVSRPGNLVVAENIVRNDTAGGIHPITAKFDLIEKGQYTQQLTPDQLPATTADKKIPLQLLEAENAIAIARAAGADTYAVDTLGKAKAFLAQGQDYYRRKQGITPIGAVARAATQSAEDARLLTIQKKQQEAAAAERQRAQDRIQAAQTQAEQQSARAAAAQEDARQQAEQRALADQERQAAEQARLEAQQAAQQAAQDRAAAQQQLQAAQQQQQALSAQAEQARLQAQQAEQARLQSEQQAEQQRQRLLTQLNQVLQTRDTARGLIVNMSDVLFDLNKATLRPGAKLRLAKVAGIILAYPDLRLEIDGFTDNTGTPQYNQALSEKRAAAVQDFLVSQGVTPGNVNIKGFGQQNPVATNATAAGRQMNRRVELVVSGTAIGRSFTPGVNSPGAPTGTPGMSSTGSVGATGQTSAAPPGTSAAPGNPQTPATPGVSGSASGTVSAPPATVPSTPSTPAAGTSPAVNTAPATTAPSSTAPASTPGSTGVQPQGTGTMQQTQPATQPTTQPPTTAPPVPSPTPDPR
jgi:outer membrane protein OmpA-like peptidoglycan-associated protein